MKEIKPPYKLKTKSIKVKIEVKNKQFTNKTFREIVRKIKFIIRTFPNKNVVINFILKDIVFLDKLSYILLETLIYSLIKEYKYSAILSMDAKIEGIYKSDIKDSFINEFNNGKLIDSNEYIYKFETKNIKKNRYRTILKSSSDTMEISIILSDITTFLSVYYKLNEDYKDNLAEAVVELLDNAREHGESDCFLEISVIDKLRKNNEEENNYIGFDITIINFSDILLGTKIKEKILNSESIGSFDKTELINIAYNNHKNFFNKIYTEEDFFNIAAFQKHVSSRNSVNNSSNSGGTGLTNLIEKLLGESEGHYCLMMTGSKFLFFREKFMKVNADGTIGFNKNNDFMTSPPDDESLQISKEAHDVLWYNFNGTCYNLNFIKKMEE